MNETVHIPILVEPITRALCEPFLATRDPRIFVDCTFGGGGHTAAFLEALRGTPHKVIGVDQDPAALERGAKRFADEIAAGRLELRRTRFADLDLKGMPVLGLLADLGFSSDQLEDHERGLSFQSDGPLDMRMDPSRGESCVDFLAQVGERELEDVLSEYGEERFSRRIAASIVRARQEGKLPRTTRELADLVARNVPPAARYGRIHAATRTFQALRIVVNDELNQLDRLLNHVTLLVQPGGRVAIISFHSLEDRRVKQFLKDRNRFEPLSKKPLEADESEIARNPRSRSAKLRIAERLKEESSECSSAGFPDGQSR